MVSEHEHSEVGLSELMVARQSRPDSRWTRSRTGGAEPPGGQPAKGLLASGLDRAGIELNKLNAFLKNGNAAGRSIENARAEAARRSAASPEMMRHTLKSVNDHVQQFAGRNVPAAPSEFVLLDTADEVSATGITLDATHLGPAPDYNWAKFRYEAERGGAGYGYPGGASVSFGFRWKNLPGAGARVTAHAYLVLDGLCAVSTEGGFFVLTNFSHLWIDADLFIHELWHDPPTSPLWQASQSQQAVNDLQVSTWGFFQAGDIASANLSRGFDLQYSDLAVPGGAAVMFEVSFNLSFYIHNGATWVDFLSHPHQMISPGVLLNVSYLEEP
jgi:hypothetical protein